MIKVISNKGFERTAKRFIKVANKTIDGMFDDFSIKERFDSHAKYIVKRNVEKLIETYKRNPFKGHSAFVEDVWVFTNIDDFFKQIKVSYTIVDSTITFKLSTKTKVGFKRKCQFVLKIN